MEKVASRWSFKSKWNNALDCAREGGEWVLFSSCIDILCNITTEQQCNDYSKNFPHLPTRWGICYGSYGAKDFSSHLKMSQQKRRCMVLPPPPKCKVAPTSRPNHLGNGENVHALRHSWILPYMPRAAKYNVSMRCVFRIRYAVGSLTVSCL